MSSYFNRLSADDQENYLKKLSLTSGEVLPDPFAIPQAGWNQDQTCFPDIGWLDIEIYLIDTPSSFTKESLRAYKSLEAYDYFVCGHVQDVFMYEVPGHPFLAIKSAVLPSQRQGHTANLYQAWVYLHKDGWVLTASCTCMAGLGSACSHIAALLIKLHACCKLDLNKVACTSKLAQWKVSKKNVDPAPLQEIKFNRPRKTTLTPHSSDVVRQANLHVNSSGEELPGEAKQSLFSIFPDAAFFTSLGDPTTTSNHSSQTYDNSQTDSASEDEHNCIPEPLTSLFEQSAINLTSSELTAHCLKRLSLYKRSYNQRDFDHLNEVTLEQALSQSWMLHRAGRITASRFFQAAHLRDHKENSSFVQNVMQYTPELNVPATKHGKVKEPLAKSEYHKVKSVTHESFELTKSGLQISADYPYLGASPDGLISCSCHGLGVLEVKCPFKYFKGKLPDYLQDKNCPLNKDISIKKGHPYYCQVQGQMMLCDRKYADLYIWTEGFNVLVPIQRDDEFIAQLHIKLEQVFMNVLLPELVTRKHDESFENMSKQLCDCRRPSFGQMIACDRKECEKEWYHYPCVNITRCPKGKWICHNCRMKKTP